MTDNTPETTGPSPLLDCAHYREPEGICQYNGCGNKMCSCCIGTCRHCRRVLCPRHQARPDRDDDDVIYCEIHLEHYYRHRLKRRLTGDR